MKQLIACLFAVTGLSWVIGCTDGDSSSNTCVPGDIEICPCGGSNPNGIQTCQEDGTWDECECGGDGDADTDIDSDADSDTDIDVDTDADTDTDTDMDTDTDTDSDTDTDTDSDNDTDSDTDSDTDGDTDTDTDVDTDTDTDTDSDTDTSECPYDCVSTNGWPCEQWGWITHDEYWCAGGDNILCCEIPAGDTDTDTDTDSDTDTDTDTDTDVDTDPPLCPVVDDPPWHQDCVYLNAETCEDIGAEPPPEEYSCEESAAWKCCRWHEKLPMCPDTDTSGCVYIVIDGHTCETYGMVTLDGYACWGGDEHVYCCDWS